MAWSARHHGRGNLVLTPSFEVGPYYVDEELNRSDVARDSNSQAQQNGVSLAITVVVHQVQG